MAVSPLTDEIEHFNLGYLLLSQRLISENKASAVVRLGIDNETADMVNSLSARQLTQLTQTGQLLTQMSDLNAERFKQITQNPKDKGMSSLHASLMLLSHRHADNDADGDNEKEASSSSAYSHD